MRLIKETKRWAFFAHYEEDGGVWGIYLDENGEAYIGAAADIPQALKFIEKWAAEQ